MSKVKRLLQNYTKHIAVPWRTDAAALQRVIFCIYDESEELRLRSRIDEFEIATQQAGYEWTLFDLTDTFAEWLSSQRYAQSYYRKPQLLSPLLPRYLTFIEDKFKSFLELNRVERNHVVALKGVGSLFGFLKVKDVVDRLAPIVKGRLLVFFPGSYDTNNNYRLLDGYDGWNYLAFAITEGKES